MVWAGWKWVHVQQADAVVAYMYAYVVVMWVMNALGGCSRRRFGGEDG